MSRLCTYIYERSKVIDVRAYSDYQCKKVNTILAAPPLCFDMPA